MPARHRRRTARWPALLGRLAAYAGLWLVVTENDLDAWPLGAAVVGATTAASWALLPAAGPRWRVSAVFRFVPRFLWDSLHGGLDVALRALDPRLPIAPDLTVHRLRLPEGLPRVVLTDTMSLLPGSLAAGSEGDRVRVHWLARGPGWREAIEVSERRVAGLFGLELPSGEHQRGGRHG